MEQLSFIKSIPESELNQIFNRVLSDFKAKKVVGFLANKEAILAEYRIRVKHRAKEIVSG